MGGGLASTRPSELLGKTNRIVISGLDSACRDGSGGMPIAGHGSGTLNVGSASLTPIWMAVGLAYAAVAALFPPVTLLQYGATGIPCAAAVVIAVRRGWLRPGWVAPSAPVPGPPLVLLLWAVLIAAAIAVKLFNFHDWPRDVHPTLSSLVARIFPVYPVRVVAFASWLWLGWYLVDR